MTHGFLFKVNTIRLWINHKNISVRESMTESEAYPMNALTFTIFGGTGDLTYRKLLPALYNLSVSQQLIQFRIVVIGRRNYSHDDYCMIAQKWIKEFSRMPYTKQAFDDFCKQLDYYQMDFTDECAYQKLDTFYQEQSMSNHIFYFAVAPRFFEIIAKGLTHVRHAAQGRVVIEKPFGKDLTSARQLNEQLEAFFGLEHIYHIDHYLGKEMVRNIQAIRFLNPIFSNLWNHEFIEHIQISAMEKVGVETRGSYYDKSGALKDMVQNHLFQILSIVAMEPMQNYTREEMHRCQLTALKQLRKAEKLDLKDTLVLGQYAGYRDENDVDQTSDTETYAALKLYIDNERWQGMPFYIRTGKKLSRREMEITITFKQPYPNAAANILMIKIQPTEGVYVRFNSKKPGNSEDIVPVSMDFCQSCQEVNRINTPEAYERLLMAVAEGDASWFSQWDQIETSWAYIDQIKELAIKHKVPIAFYAAGSDGPAEADALLSRQNHEWMSSETY